MPNGGEQGLLRPRRKVQCRVKVEEEEDQRTESQEEVVVEDAQIDQLPEQLVVVKDGRRVPNCEAIDAQQNAHEVEY